MRTRLQFNSGDLFLFVLLIGGAFAVQKWFWTPDSDYWLLFGTYLAVVSAATVAAFLSRQRCSAFLLGVAVFGWVYLALVLHGGFGLVFEHDGESLGNNSKLGLALAFLTGLTVQLWFSVFGKESR